ncbi:MAG: hypothetical protein V3V08_24985 [Nannocystaceae bacterium]
MSPLFVSQDLADRWLGQNVIQMDGDEMTFPAAPSVRLRTVAAVYFVRLDEARVDPYDVVGSVRTRKELAAMGADHLGCSVLVGECAYTVVPGFLGRPTRETGVALDATLWGELLYAIERLEGAA